MLESVTFLFASSLNTKVLPTIESGEAMVISHSPVASATNGLEGRTITPAGRPLRVIFSPGFAAPQMSAGVTPPDHGVDELSVIW